MQERALLFDFGGTLDADGLPWVDRFHSLYRSAGGRRSAEEFRPAFAEADRRLAALPDVAGFDYSATAHAQATLLASLFPDEPLIDWPALAAQFAADAHRVARRNRESLAELSRAYAMGVVSNYQGNLHHCLMELGLDDFFSVQSDSALLGVRKPEPEIFRRTLTLLNASATSTWMIGDSPPNDIAAATALGMRTCWLTPADRPADDVQATMRIAQLAELPAALERACRR